MSCAREFSADAIWDAARALLEADLGNEVSVDTIGAKDFDEEGMLTVTPPAARLLFMEETAQRIENQARNYESDLRFAVLCADQDLSADPQEGRNKALRLAGMVKHCLTGARLLLDDGSTTYPIIYMGMTPLPTADLGMAYVPAFKIEGIAYFGAPNANPQLPSSQGAQNG